LLTYWNVCVTVSTPNVVVPVWIIVSIFVVPA
jgi:hypothetical protein